MTKRVVADEQASNFLNNAARAHKRTSLLRGRGRELKTPQSMALYFQETTMEEIKDDALKVGYYYQTTHISQNLPTSNTLGFMTQQASAAQHPKCSRWCKYEDIDGKSVAKQRGSNTRLDDTSLLNGDEEEVQVEVATCQSLEAVSRPFLLTPLHFRTVLSLLNPRLQL